MIISISHKNTHIFILTSQHWYGAEILFYLFLFRHVSMRVQYLPSWLRELDGFGLLNYCRGLLPWSLVSLRWRQSLPTHWKNNSINCVSYLLGGVRTEQRDCLFILLHPLFLPATDSCTAQQIHGESTWKLFPTTGCQISYPHRFRHCGLIDSQILI